MLFVNLMPAAPIRARGKEGLPAVLARDRDGDTFEKAAERAPRPAADVGASRRLKSK